MGALGLAVSGTSKHQKTKLDAIKDLRRSTLAIARPALIPKIVAQTLQRFSPGWLSPDLEAGVSESASCQKLENRSTSSFSQVSEEQHVIWRILVSDYRRIQIRAVLSLEAVTTLWPSAPNCGERTSPSWRIGPATGIGQHVFRFSSSAVSLTREHPPISDCLSG